MKAFLIAAALGAAALAGADAGAYADKGGAQQGAPVAGGGDQHGQRPDDQQGERRDEAPSPYVVLHENVRVSFARHAIHGYRVGVDRRSVIFDAIGHWYRGELDRGCWSDLRYSSRIGLDLRHNIDTLDRSSSVFIDGRRCPLWRLDEIANPRGIRERDYDRDGRRKEH